MKNNKFLSKLQINISNNRSTYLSIFAILTIIVIRITSMTEAECMDNDRIKDTLEAYQQNELTPEEAERFLIELENTNDPEMINAYRLFIEGFARENNLNVNAILPLNLQHAIPGLEGNIGNIPQQDYRSWTDILIALGLAISITVIVYIIMRNWEAIRDILFDMGNRTLTVSPNIDSRTLFRIGGILLNNPNTRVVFASALGRRFANNAFYQIEE